ncbi:MAG: ADP-forming succinate--CoA ligase subunit beta [Fimbriimonas sp.]|nr:ADP-forming succinate--CoA ligase subunit beta [Fimbriimonas sp.]
MKLHEYQSKELLARYGVPVPAGDVTSDPIEAKAIAERLGGKVVVKAQVLMGGRGKAGGVKLFDTADDAAAFAKDLIGKRLISKQNPTGMVVEKILIAETVDIAKEFYVAVLLDRNIQKSIVMISAEGGMEIEEVAETNPGAIVKVAIDPAWGLSDFQLRKAIKDANIPKEARNQMVSMIKNLVRAYEAADAEMVEINPCALTPEGKLIAADAKVSIDDNSLFRHKDYQATSSDSAEDPIEAEANRRGIAYVKLGGEIGIIGNGAGLVMQSLDEITAAGGTPANFLDVGGGAKEDRVRSCVELILMDPAVKGLFINIFGGITRVDEVAKGVLAAFATLDTDIPVVARIEGTAVEEGRKILAGSRIVPAETVQEGAKKIVELARG